MKQRIWIVSWYGQSAGGLERIVQILNCILMEQYEVTIIDIPFIQQFKRWRKLVCCENRILLMLTFSAFARWIVGKGDILITHGQNAPFVRSDFLFDHGSIMSLKRQTGEFIYGGSTVFEYIAVKNAKMNIAVSTWTMEQIISNYHVNRNKIMLLNNCVETDIFYPVNKNFNNRTIILFCGRLEEAKGLSVLRQIAKIVEKSSNFELKIAANDSKNVELFKGKEHISIRCGIPVEEMNAFYNSGDVLLVPSYCEGFGMGITESLASGVPVVSNKVGIISDLIYDKCPGISVIEKNESIEGILAKVEQIALQFRDTQKRLLLHAYVEKNYGYFQYADKLLKIIKGNKYAEC